MRNQIAIKTTLLKPFFYIKRALLRIGQFFMKLSLREVSYFHVVAFFILFLTLSGLMVGVLLWRLGLSEVKTEHGLHKAEITAPLITNLDLPAITTDSPPVEDEIIFQPVKQLALAHHFPLGKISLPFLKEPQGKLHIMITDLGINAEITEYVLARFPKEIMLSFAANTPSLSLWLEVAEKHGHQLYLDHLVENTDIRNIVSGFVLQQEAQKMLLDSAVSISAQDREQLVLYPTPLIDDIKQKVPHVPLYLVTNKFDSSLTTIAMQQLWQEIIQLAKEHEGTLVVIKPFPGLLQALLWGMDALIKADIAIVPVQVPEGK